METLSFSGERFWDLSIKIIITVILTLPSAWERSQSTKTMGFRTYVLVAVASCSYVIVAVVGAGSDAQARIIQGLMGGIGFIGGGAILKDGEIVRGTATAASIWATGAMGAAIGYALYEIAVLLSIVMVGTLHAFPASRSVSADG